MIPIVFDEANVVAGSGQPEYQPLPIHQGPEPHEVCTSAWSLTAEEIDRVMLTGTIWVQQCKFQGPLQPILLTVEKPEGMA